MMNNPLSIMQGITSSPIAPIVGALRNGKNPVAMIQQMAGRNPQMAQAMQIINGKSPQQLQQIAMNMANERGIDINQLIQSLGIR